MLTNTNLGLIEKTNRTAGVRESHQTTIPVPTLTKEDVNKNRYAVTPINRGNNVGTRDSLNGNKQSFRQPTQGHLNKSDIDGLTAKLANYDMTSSHPIYGNIREAHIAEPPMII